MTSFFAPCEHVKLPEDPLLPDDPNGGEWCDLDAVITSPSRSLAPPRRLMFQLLLRLLALFPQRCNQWSCQVNAQSSQPSEKRREYSFVVIHMNLNDDWRVWFNGEYSLKLRVSIKLEHLMKNFFPVETCQEIKWWSTNLHCINWEYSFVVIYLSFEECDSMREDARIFSQSSLNI